MTVIKKTSVKKTAVITGGASGIGLSLAKQLAAESYNVIIIGRNLHRLREAQKNIGTHGNKVHSKVRFKVDCLVADVGKWEQLNQAAMQCKSNYGQVDLLIVNAGIVEVNAIADMPAEQIASVLQTNLIGAAQTVKSFLPLLPNGGKIIFISSGYGIVAPAGYAAYAASKGGMILFAEALRRELAYRNIRVQVALLTDTDTPQLAYEAQQKPEWMRGRVHAPIRRMHPDKVAQKLLKQRFKKKFFIFVSWDVRLAYIATKLLPRTWRDGLVNLFFPAPD